MTKPKLIYRMLHCGTMAGCEDAPKGIWRFIQLVAVVLVLAFAGHAQDVHVDCANVNPCTLTPGGSPGGLAWSGGNQTWIFTPISPNATVFISIHNQNTTSAHTSQTVQVWQTGFGRPTAPSLTQNSDFWVQDVVTQNVTAGASCNSVNAKVAGTPGASGLGTCYAVGMQAAQIAIRITGANTQAGSPDTFDLAITQAVSSTVGGPQPGDRQYEIAGENGVGVGAAGTNPVLIGCDVGAQAITQATGTIQFIGCDTLGNLQVVGPVAPGVTGAGLNPLIAGVLDGGTTLARAIPGQSIQAQATSSSPGSALFGMPIITGPAVWSVPVQATTASQCSASQAAVAATRHCATGVIVCATATAAQVQLFANLRDGASGAGTVKWNGLVGGTGASGGTSCVTKEFNGPICGSTNTAMTLELSAATAATNGCATTLAGYDIQ